MVARATLIEIDTVRLGVEEAVELFEESVLPALREQDGYKGVYVLATSEGKGLVLSFWRDEAAAEASIASGFYSEQVAKFVTVFRAPPGRELYRVAVAEAPAGAPS